MSLTIQSLEEYNDAVRSRSDEDSPIAPIVFDNKYRVRLIPLSEIPIFEHHSNIDGIGLRKNQAILIDSVVERKREMKRSIKAEETESMETNEKENDENSHILPDESGFAMKTSERPLETSFLTLEKLSNSDGGENVEIEGFTFEQEPFDCNPLSFSEGVSLNKTIREDNYYFSAVEDYPICIAVTGNTLPIVTWLITGKAVKKNIVFNGITRVLGYLNTEVEDQVALLNKAIQGNESKKCRAVYDFIRKFVTKERKAPGEVTVDIRWATTTAHLLDEPASTADCTVNVDLGWRDDRFFPDQSLFNQLFYAMNLAEVLSNSEKDVVFPSGPRPFDELKADMQDLITSCSEDDNVFANNTSYDGEVTEKVWDIIRKSADIKEVIILLKTFLQALTYGKIKSHVHVENKSRLAELIRTSKTSEFRMPILERLSTIEMMMEIGVECLRRKVINKLADSLSFPKEELQSILSNCEKELEKLGTNLNLTAIVLLPIAMSFATVYQFFGILNQKDYSILPDLTRKILGLYVNILLDHAKNPDADLMFSFQTTFSFLKIDKEMFSTKKPRVWTCETARLQGGIAVAKTMTCLQLEMPLDYVNNAVNATRPTKENDEAPTADDLKAKYTASHTFLTYNRI